MTNLNYVLFSQKCICKIELFVSVEIKESLTRCKNLTILTSVRFRTYYDMNYYFIKFYEKFLITKVLAKSMYVHDTFNFE